MKKVILFALLHGFTLCVTAQEKLKYPLEVESKSTKLSGFVTSPYFGEQIMEFTYDPGIKVHINAPSESEFDKNKPTKLVFYALPNGNSIDWTIGKLPRVGDDWHYYIQHIGAQTRFVRSVDKVCNLVTVYLEAETKSWGSWRKVDSTRDQKIKKTIEDVLSLFSAYNASVELNSHSGGGNIIFGFMDANHHIPNYVTSISFIDSNYNWDDKRYGGKLKDWLESSLDTKLFVACYDDANALLNGKSFVSKKGGTWHRTYLMQRYLKKKMKRIQWKKTETDSLIYFTADNRRIQFYSKKNPFREIYHTILVERNGYIQSLLAGTKWEQVGYQFMGERAYDSYRQDSIIQPHVFRFPPRSNEAITGSLFVQKVRHMTVEEREDAIYKAITEGNVPNSFRQPIYLRDCLEDATGEWHEVTYCVLPDFLAIGPDDDFIRMPMLPHTAQKIADALGATLPTRKLSKLIHQHSPQKMVPSPMKSDSTMTTIPVFAQHDSIVEKARQATGKPLNTLIAGHKKDIVISNDIHHKPNRLFIYGWHYPSGEEIQQLNSSHRIDYVDYSHGVRLVRDEVLVDGKLHSLKELLQDEVFYTMFSDESSAMKMPHYY